MIYKIIIIFILFIITNCNTLRDFQIHEIIGNLYINNERIKVKKNDSFDVKKGDVIEFVGEKLNLQPIKTEKFEDIQLIMIKKGKIEIVDFNKYYIEKGNVEFRVREDKYNIEILTDVLKIVPLKKANFEIQKTERDSYICSQILLLSDNVLDYVKYSVIKNNDLRIVNKNNDLVEFPELNQNEFVLKKHSPPICKRRN